jgi:hypothetical protein
VLASSLLSILPSAKTVSSWFVDHKGLGARFTLEFLLLSGGIHVVIFSSGWDGGVDQIGALRGALTLLGPVTVLAYGIVGFAVPEGARITKRADRRFGPLVALVTIVMIVSVFVWTLAAWLLPDDVGRVVLGDTWEGTQSVIVPFGVAIAGSLGIVGVTVGLRSLAAAKMSLRANAASTLLLVVIGSAGGILGGAKGAATAMIVPNWIGFVIYAWTFRRALEEHGRESSEAADATEQPADS